MTRAKRAPRQLAPAPLPAGTRVQHRVRGATGTVQKYDPQWSKGIFPVRWDGTQIWEACTADYVTAVPQAPS